MIERLWRVNGEKSFGVAYRLIIFVASRRAGIRAGEPSQRGTVLLYHFEALPCLAVGSRRAWMKPERKTDMRRWLGLAVLLGAGLVNVARAQGPGDFDGQYVGELALTRVISGDCTKPPLGSTYPLAISGGIVRFKYVPRFDTVLTGRVDRNGNFRAARQLKRGTVVMTGHTNGINLSATLISPSCQYTYTARY